MTVINAQAAATQADMTERQVASKGRVSLALSTQGGL